MTRARDLSRFTNPSAVSVEAGTFNIGIGSTSPDVKLDVIGSIEASGISTFQNNLFVGAGITMLASSGIVSAVSFYGDGSGLTGVASTDNILSNAINVSGISTLGSSNGIGTVTIGLGTEALHVDGNARIVGILTVGRTSITFNGTNNRIGIGSATPQTTLDLSQETGGIALPQGTTAQRPTGDNPYLRWNSSNNALEFYNGSNWVEIISDYFPSGSTILG